jgi:hypothetical protein
MRTTLRTRSKKAPSPLIKNFLLKLTYVNKPHHARLYFLISSLSHAHSYLRIYAFCRFHRVTFLVFLPIYLLSLSLSLFLALTTIFFLPLSDLPSHIKRYKTYGTTAADTAVAAGPNVIIYKL